MAVGLDPDPMGLGETGRDVGSGWDAGNWGIIQQLSFMGDDSDNWGLGGIMQQLGFGGLFQQWGLERGFQRLGFGG